MIMCVLLCYPLSIHMSQLLSTGRPISSFLNCKVYKVDTYWGHSLGGVGVHHGVAFNFGSVLF